MGDAHARRFWAAGCRSLEDVARQPGLTQQQRAGLAHFADFERRVPRAEVAECEAIVYGVGAGRCLYC